MHYKKIFIYILLVSIAFMQSQYNYGRPENIENGDAKSMGIGNTYLTLGSNSAVTSINPARLAYISKNSKTNILVDFQLMRLVGLSGAIFLIQQLVLKKQLAIQLMLIHLVF